MIGPTDLYVLAGALSSEEETWTLRELAARLHVDHTLVHRALKRAESVGLYSSNTGRVNAANFEELTIHAARFVAPARLGELVPGIPAAWAAQPISKIIRELENEPPPVWPSVHGKIRGQALQPLHPAAVQASQDTPAIAELLCVIDSLRAGDVRVREVAANALRETLNQSTRPQRTAA